MDSWTDALAAWEDGRYDDAADALQRLLTETPGNIQARHLLGVVKVELGDFEEAIKQLKIVCAAEPGNGDAWSVLGNAQRLAGAVAEAEVTFRAGLANAPNNPHLHFNLGLVLCQLKRPGEAEAAFRRASELDPVDQECWVQLGLLQFARGDHQGAASAFQHAAELGGARRAYAMRLAGFALADAGNSEQAAQLLASLCPPQPDEAPDFHLLTQLLYCRLELCDWRQFDVLVRRCREFVAAGAVPLEPFTFLLLPGMSPREQLVLTAGFAQSVAPEGLAPITPRAEREPARRLRLGYLSADFHDHAVMRLLAGVLEHHDHAAYEIHAFSYGGPDAGEMRQRIVAACDFFHDVSTLAPAQMAQKIASQDIDIVLDLTGWTGNSKSAVLGYRPAPVQVNWLGYSGTLGSKRLADYLIGDAIVTPLADQDKFAETLALMPHCCHPNDVSRRIGKPRSRKDEGLPEGVTVFCCFSRPVKIIPEVFYCWCDMLREVPGSVLWLLAANETAAANLAAAAVAQGIDPARLVFSTAMPPPEHLARLSLADLALDTFPFGAHTTAGDALWAGLPVLTLMGETFQSRVTASMLHAIGLVELVTHSLDDYRARAIELGNSPQLLNSVRTGLAARRLSSPLFDTKGFAGDLETLLRSLWQSYCCEKDGG